MFFGKHHKVFYDHLAAYIHTRVEDGAFRRVDPLLAARAFIAWSFTIACCTKSSAYRWTARMMTLSLAMSMYFSTGLWQRLRPAAPAS